MSTLSSNVLSSGVSHEDLKGRGDPCVSSLEYRIVLRMWASTPAIGRVFHQTCGTHWEALITQFPAWLGLPRQLASSAFRYRSVRGCKQESPVKIMC